MGCISALSGLSTFGRLHLGTPSRDVPRSPDMGGGLGQTHPAAPRHPSEEGSRKSSPLGAGEADEEGRATTRVAPTSSRPSPLGGGPALRGRRRLEHITMPCSASLAPFRRAGLRPAGGQDGRAPRHREGERPEAGAAGWGKPTPPLRGTPPGRGWDGLRLVLP